MKHLSQPPETLIFLPGMMCDERIFTPQIAYLSNHQTVIYQTMTMSFIGCSSITQMAEKTLDEAPKSFNLLGLSMGGIVAMEVMRLAKSCVQRLALFDTNPFADNPNSRKIRDSHMKRIRENKLKTIMRDALKPRYLANGSCKHTILALCMDMALKLGDDVFIEQNIALRERTSQEDTLADIRVPTLVLCGKEDSLCPLTRHTFMHQKIKNSVLSIIDGAGHLPTLEQPELTNVSIESWLQAS